MLYDIERKAKDQQLDAEQILQMRRQEAVAVLESLGARMEGRQPIAVTKYPSVEVHSQVIV